MFLIEKNGDRNGRKCNFNILKQILALFHEESLSKDFYKQKRFYFFFGNLILVSLHVQRFWLYVKVLHTEKQLLKTLIVLSNMCDPVVKRADTCNINIYFSERF